MGDQGATGGAWGARDEASWWPGGAGELQNQQQLNEEIARSTAASTQQLYTYKMTGGQFTNNSSENTSSNYGYRLVSNNREESPQQQWWYSSGAIDSQQQNSSPTVIIMLIYLNVSSSIELQINKMNLSNLILYIYIYNFLFI